MATKQMPMPMKKSPQPMEKMMAKEKKKKGC
jgi:hypothetical protein